MNLAKLLICTTPLSRLDNLSSMQDLPSTPSLQSAHLCSPLLVIFAPLSLRLPPTFWSAWFSELPTIARFGIEWDWSPIGLSLLAQQLIFQPLAVAAIVLARQDEHLWLGAIFVALPPANLLLGMIIFTIAVMIYGF